MKRGDQMVNATCKAWQICQMGAGEFPLRSRSFAINHYGKIPAPIIMAATGHKSESAFLKYISKGRAEVISILAEY